MSRTNSNPKAIIVIQGGQWGSESKGTIAAELCIRRDVDFAVRTGTINAGHSCHFEGKKYAMQTLPTGWVNPRTSLVVGPGAYVHPAVLMRELECIDRATGENPYRRVLVDRRAGLHLDAHTERAQGANRHVAMGATGKGCSEAVVAKIANRGTGEIVLFADWVRDRQHTDPIANEFARHLPFFDTVSILHDAYDGGKQILLEGTQGSLLDLHLGPYPYVTHKGTQAVQWVAEAGLAPGMEYEVILVCRTFPIRVAGNSGPMPNEIGWPALAREINEKLFSEPNGQLDQCPGFVAEWALKAFDQACQYQAVEMELAKDIDPRIAHTPELWRQEEREEHRWAVSELHTRAFNSLQPEAQAELRRLFEFTTVTNKLRRIARWDWDSVRWACRVNRPTSIALTFMNYRLPEFWNLTNEVAQRLDERTQRQIWGFADEVAAELGVPVQYLSFGPEGRHIVGPATI